MQCALFYSFILGFHFSIFMTLNNSPQYFLKFFAEFVFMVKRHYHQGGNGGVPTYSQEGLQKIEQYNCCLNELNEEI